MRDANQLCIAGRDGARMERVPESKSPRPSIERNVPRNRDHVELAGIQSFETELAELIRCRVQLHGDRREWHFAAVARLERGHERAGNTAAGAVHDAPD